MQCLQKEPARKKIKNKVIIDKKIRFFHFFPVKINAIFIVFVIIALLLFLSYNSFISKKENSRHMNIISARFKNGEEIPKEFTCEGDNFNPPLTFSDIPQNTKSLALVVEDPDAPVGIWYHWLLYNISPETSHIGEHSKPDGAIEGLANGGTPGYEGPCPPNPQAHRYIFTLYALDQMFQLSKDTDVPKFREVVNGHIIEQTTLMGIYNGPAKRAKPL